MNKISRNKITPKINIIKKSFISQHLAFIQIYKLYDYGQYKMHGNVINFLANMNETQSILQCRPHDDAIIGVF